MSSTSGNVTVARRAVLDGPSDYLIASLIVLAAFITLGTWATGQLAGLITHAAWPHVSIGKALSIAKLIPRHLGDPKQAWPATARAELPGPVGFSMAAVIVLALFAVTLVAFVRRSGTRRQVRGYASPSQLAATLSQKAALARGTVVRPSLTGIKFAILDVAVSLGRTLTGTALWSSIENSVLMLAAPRQGKTSMVVIPWLHHWRGAALVTSVRPDVLENTAQLRRARGPVYVMAPTGMIDWPDRVRWSPTSDCEDFGKAYQRADIMVQIGKSETASDSTGAGFFGTTATTMLAAWLHAAAISGKTMRDVLRWALDERIEEPITILAEHPGAESGISSVLDGIYRSPAETRSNMFTTAQTAITPLLSPKARDTFTPAAGESIDLEAFLRSKGTIYLMVSEKQAAALAPLIAAFVDEVTETAKRIADRSPRGRLDPPLGLFLDEVANVAPLPHLPALMSYAGGSGIFVVAILQNIAQARGRWGTDGAAMLWGAATLKIALGGLTGDEVDDFSDLAGIYRESLTTQQRGANGTTLQTTLQDRKTITPDQVRTLSEARREALLIHATTPATKVRMQRHYESPHAKDYEAACAWADQYANPVDNAQRLVQEGSAA
ncbi:MAG TPA: type IV secretory system conjugative DNA transfer family protein [Actinocrinis sp.]|uniref:type IV secretory system conjugative DNA transfer family protein n=1 Tax=Actinocrinis sp. TaxID=1920516 RepID=UPI002DDCE203|nr:type IV secretory system conjugative DNA transfer family protein [Actinocrinis sp.]HEV2347919.1 type IV secretory system conjugative DNA transfer family protein [Actinocrinis sp.]